MAKLKVAVAFATLCLASCAGPKAQPVEHATPPVAKPPAGTDAAPTVIDSHDDSGTSVNDDRLAVVAPASEPAQPLSQERSIHYLDAPPFGYHLGKPAAVSSRGPQPRLVKRKESKNKIVDDAEWLEANDLRLPTLEVPNPNMKRAGNLPAHIETSFDGLPIVAAIDHGDHQIALYAKDYSGGRFLVVLDSNQREAHTLDFESWSFAPKSNPAERLFVDQRISWAQVHEGVLYVSTTHNTYAKSSGGQNAFLSAIDLRSGTLLWQSEPLVANSRNFLLRDGWIITGYGFTAEPDFLYVLDMETGKTASTTKLKSGPSFILEKNSTLFVRTYNTNYEFAIQ